jgi:hypothetical protein
MQGGLLKIGVCTVVSDFCSGTVETASRNDQGGAQFQTAATAPVDTSPASRVTPVFLTCCGQTRHAGGPSQDRCVHCGVRFLQRHVKTASRNDQGGAQFQTAATAPVDTSPASRVTPVFLTCCGQTRHAGGPSRAQIPRRAVRFLQQAVRHRMTATRNGQGGGFVVA